MSEHVSLTVDDGIATLRVCRPPVNALDAAVQEGIRHRAEEAARRDDVSAVVISGGDQHFAVGADVKEMASMTHADMVKRSGALQSAFSAVAMIPKPVVAAIRGYALGGGCELALCADYRVAASDARMGQPEILLGIIPGAGGTQRLSRLIGPSRAKDLIFSGRQVTADEALTLGLVDAVVEPDEVVAAATKWAAQFKGAATLALRAAKCAIDTGLEVDLHTGLEIERQQFTALFATEDRHIGMQSFISRGPGRATFAGC